MNTIEECFPVVLFYVVERRYEIYSTVLSSEIMKLVRALHRYRRGQGSNPGKPDFFRLSFRNCIGCVNNCEDFLYI